MQSTYISDVRAYSKAFLAGEDAKVRGLCGRILRGKQPSDFMLLTDDPQRKIVMLMGADGLRVMLGKQGYEMLTSIGYTHEQIKYLTDSGLSFKLVVFRQDDDFSPATWQEVIKLAGEVYPGAAAALEAQLSELSKVAFEEIQAASGYPLSSVKEADDPRYMTYDRYMQSDQGLVATRAFLYYTLQLRELYRGDGYTYTPDGHRGLSEYCTKNASLETFEQYELIDLPPIHAP